MSDGSVPDNEDALAPYHRGGAERVPGQYMVMVREGADPAAVAARAGVRTEFVYRFALTGFSARMSDAQLDLIRRDPDVLHIEDSVMGKFG